MYKHYQMILQEANRRAQKAMYKQVLDVESPFYGGFRNPHHVIQAKNSIYEITKLAMVYCHEASDYYNDETVYKSMVLGLTYVASVQRENGLFDYVTCNFDSAPDTAFCLKKLLPVYQYLSVERSVKNQEPLYKMLEVIIKKGAYGLLEGGFHTPNHRWAIASVLGICANLFKDEAMKSAMDSYLIEGIDCNADGEFAERSAGNYNRINNDAMIWLTEATGDPSYEAYALKNLQMMLTYIEPDGSVFTANSTRFDKDAKVYPKYYYWQYLYLGQKYHKPEFLRMANKIMAIVAEKQITAPDFLIHFMNHPECIEGEIEGEGEVEGVYEVQESVHYYQASGIGRYLNKDISLTVLKDKSNFLYFNNGSITLELKLSGSYFEHRGFKPDQIELIEGKTFKLSQQMKGWYYLPFKTAQATADWWAMDHSKREIKAGPTLNLTVWVTPIETSVDVRIKVDGPDQAPFRVEMALAGIETIETEHMAIHVTGSEALVIKEGMVEVSNASSSMIIGPAFGNHRFIEGKEDSDAKHPGCATVYFTDYTSFERQFRIQNFRLG
ncbi:hypothetical protein [Fusibacter sp. 3D3]|uniref:hypothetical protein n=1 Tax=Fusibacter sp. 3D3 TaxID=1048380 RepID=UPI000853B5AC|nr:hypothetical protein [Fusibacter sp. 3D3]GAU76663.1 hypothetical protein F3D3_1260 [Fusibacter sp. 3D3]